MEVAITHSSTACVLLEIDSVRILTDPVLDGGFKRYRLGPAAWATRYVGPALNPDQIPPLDAVLLSHSHHLDNLDEGGMAVVRRAKQVITGSVGGLGKQVKALTLAPWQETTIKGERGELVRVIATPGLHGPPWFPGTHKVVGYVLQWDGQENGALYISGDTIFFRGIAEIARRFQIGTAILHLGAVNFWPPWPPFLRFTFNGHEAARTARLLRSKTIIPIHYERSIWSHFRETQESYKGRFEDAGVEQSVTWLEHGKRTVIKV